ncbi:gem-associated protein 5 [Pristis pectinata]|uniref:gem-associated protein 5 n=1 Tax=Pristis pectinata TaxID=685728 RepID=UPI00223D6C5E|nr:gem-associated protein 5 [Pristis pectinata]
MPGTGAAGTGHPAMPGTVGTDGTGHPSMPGAGAAGTGHPAMPGTVGTDGTGHPAMPGTVGTDGTGHPAMPGTGAAGTGHPAMPGTGAAGTGHPAMPGTGAAGTGHPAMPGTGAAGTGHPAMPGAGAAGTGHPAMPGTGAGAAGSAEREAGEPRGAAMSGRLLTPSPNWYCSRCSDGGPGPGRRLGFGAKNSIFLLEVTRSRPLILGELTGHTERVTGFSFCPHASLANTCASTSDDGTVKIWDTETKAVLKEHAAHQTTITALHWSPLRKDLVVSGDEKGLVICWWHFKDDTQSFFPEPRHIFCLSCSPHHEEHVAVGYKDGMIVIIDIHRKGAVVHRLRGHDGEIQSLAWCPQLCEEGLLSRAESEAETDWPNGDPVKEETERFCALASGSRDQTIRIWNSSTGKGLLTLKLPQLKRRGVADLGTKERIWLTVHWPQNHPTQLVSSSFGGELLLWDLAKAGKQKWTLLGQSEGQNHSRIVFNLSSVCGEDARELLLSTSMDRDVKCWDLTTLDCCWTQPTLGGFVYSLAFSPVNIGSLAVGVGDGMIRVWDTISLQGPYHIKTLWQGIKSKVTSLCWHPTKESLLAFGTEDGKVGIYEIYSNKPPQISSSYHRKTVYAVAWGPPVPPVTTAGTGDGPALTLYSCAGEGIILQHNPWRLTADAQDINRVIRETNGIKHKLPGRSELSWKPDGTVLAIGNDDGSIEIFQPPLLKLLCTIQTHHKLINAIRWHHPHSSDPNLGFLIASGSNNAVVYVHNLKPVLEHPSETLTTMIEPFRTLTGHTAKITSLAWSPHHDAVLVSACYDGTAQVWDVLKDEPMCNYRGHTGRLLAVQWSPVDADIVWTGGDDFTVRQWEVSKQEHTRPPQGKKVSELERKKVNGLKPKSKKSRKKAEKCVVGQEGAGLLDTSPQTLLAPSVREEKQEFQGEVESASDETSRAPAPLEELGVRGNTESLPPTAAQVPTNQRRREQTRDERKREKPEAVVKKKGRSMLPLSTSNDHRSKEELHSDCVNLASILYAKGSDGRGQAGAGDQVQLGLFVDRPALYRMFQEEEKNHVEAGHPEMRYQLLLWKGDVKGALDMAIERGELNDTLVAMAPMAGYAVWVRTIEAFVKQLCFQEQYTRAATLLLSIHRVDQAIQLLQTHQLFREAIALAKAFLQPDDPVLKELFTSWASLLEKDGHYSIAAKCYLAAESPYDAAKILAKKGDVASLRTAAKVASITGERELSAQLSSRCALDLLSQRDWLGAQDVLRGNESLLGQRLVLCTYEQLYRRLAERELVLWRSINPPRYHGWSLCPEGSLIDSMLTVWRSEFGVTVADEGRLEAAHCQLRTTEYPEASANTPARLLQLQLSHELSLALSCVLLSDYAESVTVLLKVVVRCLSAGNFALMQEIGNVLFPDGAEFIPDLEAKLTPDPFGLAALQSLRAFLCYGQLYELWWELGTKRSRTLRASAEGRPDVGQESEEGSKEAGDGPRPGLLANVSGRYVDGATSEPRTAARALLAGCGCLLSADHARRQALERRVAEIQRAVAALVSVHRSRRSSTEAQRSGPELRVGSGPEVQPEMGPGVRPEPKSDPTFGPNPDSGARPKLETEPDVGPEPEATTRPELEVGTEPESAPEDGSKAMSSEGPSSSHCKQELPLREEGAVSMVSLMQELRDINQEQSDIAETVKRHPFPDVTESCLVLLAVGSLAPSLLPPALRDSALSLAQAYGTAKVQQIVQKFGRDTA